MRIVPTFFYERDGCRGNYPSFTTSLSKETNFQWDGIDSRPLSVGEFVRAASGKVVVLIDDKSRDGAAFALVSAIGTVNNAIRSIDVKAFDGSVPSGYDYAMVVGAGEKIESLNPPLRVTSKNFSIYDADGKTLRFQADYSVPFGVLETAQASGTPTLIATYWKDAGVLNGITRLQPDDLSAQTDSVMVFNSNQATYTNTDRRLPPSGDAFALSIPIIIAFFVILLLVTVFLASRRKV